MNRSIIKEKNAQISTIILANYHQLSSMKDMNSAYLQKATDLFIDVIHEEVIPKNSSDSEFMVNIENDCGVFQAMVVVNLDTKHYSFIVKNNECHSKPCKLIITNLNNTWYVMTNKY